MHTYIKCLALRLRHNTRFELCAVNVNVVTKKDAQLMEALHTGIDCAGQKQGQVSTDDVNNSKDVVSMEVDVICVEEVPANVIADVMVTEELPSIERYFNPVSKTLAAEMCKTLNVAFEGNTDEWSCSGSALGPPCRTAVMVGDGNCFFRAVSHVVSGSQEHHIKLRHAVVNYMKNNQNECGQYLRHEYSSVMEYLQKTRMKYANVWATEVEIQTMANLLKLDVYTYSGDRWLSYKCAQRTESMPGIYLHHCNENHYNVVLCVKDVHTQQCHST